jgi:hypothetical protein
MVTATNKEEKAMWQCYRLLYENSTPSADFDELVEKAEFNERGQKVIDFDSYEIEEEKFYEIMDGVLKENKIKGYRAQAFRNSILLGCSPRFKKANKDEQ